MDLGDSAGWDDLAPDDWQQGALRAATTETTLDETIVVAARQSDTGEFIYVRCSPDTALQLMQRLAEALDRGPQQGSDSG